MSMTHKRLQSNSRSFRLWTVNIINTSASVNIWNLWVLTYQLVSLLFLYYSYHIRLSPTEFSQHVWVVVQSSTGSFISSFVGCSSSSLPVHVLEWTVVMLLKWAVSLGVLQPSKSIISLFFWNLYFSASSCCNMNKRNLMQASDKGAISFWTNETE